MRTLVLTNVLAHYRKEFWQTVANEDVLDITLVSGYSKAGIETFQDQIEGIRCVQCRNAYFRRFLVFQFVPVSVIFQRWHGVVLLGEVQVVSSWLLLILFKILGVRTVVWTHGLYGNEGRLKRWIRLIFYDLFDQVLVYNNRSAGLLKVGGIQKEKIKVIYNSFNYHELKYLSKTKAPQKFETFSLVFIGRLTAVKRLDLVIRALRGVEARGITMDLHLIGDGACRAVLEDMVARTEMQKQVYFHGKMLDLSESTPLIRMCHLGVAPGNVGLTAVHLFSLGIPVITHGDWNFQMPEREIIEENVTGGTFLRDDVTSLTNELLKWHDSWLSGKLPAPNRTREKIEESYNPKAQGRVFIEALTMK